jgi:hypothetical protein
MRSLLLGIFLLIISCVGQERPFEAGVYDSEKTLLKHELDLAKAIAKEYAPDATIFIIADQPLAYGIGGLTNNPFENTYFVQITRDNPSRVSTLFHELGHVIDAEDGRLEWAPFKWEGRAIDFSAPWNERPWELSAEEWKECLRYEYENRQLEHYDYALEDWLKSFKLNLIYFK